MSEANNTPTPAANMSKAARRDARIAAARRAKTRKTVITVAIILAVLILLTPLALFSSGAIYRMAKAVTIGGHSYSTAEFNYFYYNTLQSTYSDLYDTYGEYTSMFLDTSLPLDEQLYAEDKTWADYVRETTVTNMETITMLNDEAAAAGFTLSAEQEQELQALYQATYEAGPAYGYSTSGYLQAVYGTGMSAAVFESCSRQAYIAEVYGNSIVTGLTYTAEDVSDAYAVSPNDYDFVTYRVYDFSGLAAEGEDEAAALAAARETADQMLARVTAGEVFQDVAYDLADEDSRAYLEHPDATLSANTDYATASATTYGDWLFDAARQPGDADVFDYGGGFSVVQFVSRDDNDYNTRSFRHFLIAPEAAEDGTVSDEARLAAVTEAQALLDGWKAGEATPEAFGTMAEENNDDTANTAEGGLFENVPRNQVVTEVNDWLFDAARQAGDTAVIESEFGAHVVFYVGENANMRTLLVEHDLRSAEYSAWLNERVANYPAQISSFGYNLAGQV